MGSIHHSTAYSPTQPALVQLFIIATSSSRSQFASAAANSRKLVILHKQGFSTLALQNDLMLCARPCPICGNVVAPWSCRHLAVSARSADTEMSNHLRLAGTTCQRAGFPVLSSQIFPPAQSVSVSLFNLHKTRPHIFHLIILADLHMRIWTAYKICQAGSI